MKPIALLFPGQGSQYPGMGLRLFQRSRLAKDTFEEASDALGMDMWRLCCKAEQQELTRTENTQPSLLTVGVAAFRVFMDEVGLTPSVLAGHSLGELTALACAGAIPFADAVRLARKRGQFMQDAMATEQGAMAAVGNIDVDALNGVCSELKARGDYVDISNMNSPKQMVVSGYRSAVLALEEQLRSRGARVTLLKVSAPFHSRLMRPAAERFAAELRGYSFVVPKFTVLSNVTGLPHDGTNTANLLVEQIISPVHWVQCMNYLQDQGIAAAVDLGPGVVVRNLVKPSAPDVRPYGFDDETDAAVIRNWVSAVVQ